MFLSEFFMPVTVVAFLVTFAKYFTVNWFGIFMPALIGTELLLFVGTRGGKSFEGEVVPNVSSPVRRPQSPPELEKERPAEEDTPKKTAAQQKQEKANAKKAASAEKASNKKTK